MKAPCQRAVRFRAVLSRSTAHGVTAACRKNMNESATTRDGTKVAMKTKGDQSQMETTSIRPGNFENF